MNTQVRSNTPSRGADEGKTDVAFMALPELEQECAEVETELEALTRIAKAALVIGRQARHEVAEEYMQVVARLGAFRRELSSRYWVCTRGEALGERVPADLDPDLEANAEFSCIADMSEEELSAESIELTLLDQAIWYDVAEQEEKTGKPPANLSELLAESMRCARWIEALQQELGRRWLEGRREAAH